MENKMRLPWRIIDDGDDFACVVIQNCDGVAICEVPKSDLPYARLIVASANACADVDVEYLEHEVQLKPTIEELLELRTANAKLKAKLKRTISIGRMMGICDQVQHGISMGEYEGIPKMCNEAMDAVEFVVRLIQKEGE